MVALIDMTGKKCGRWTVLGIGPTENGKRRWRCRCECGAEGLVIGDLLRRGHSTSCGCRSREVTRGLLTTHGATGTPLFAVWKGMRSRCKNPNGRSFKDYGARGIEVCARWETFENFAADMGASYRPGLTIERRDNDGGYSPENCDWVPKARQSRNRRTTIFVDTTQGQMTVSEAARLAGVSFCAMRNRAVKKWPIDEMLSPARKTPAHEGATDKRRLSSAKRD